MASLPPQVPPGTSQHLRAEGVILERYLMLCGDLVDRGWFATPVRFTAGRGPDTIEHGGEDLLRSTMLTFRQLFAKNEPTWFGTICKKTERIAYNAGELNLRDRARSAKKLYRERMEDRRLIIVDDRRQPFAPDGRREITAREVIDDWLYSGHFHWDEDKRQRVQAWGQPAYELQLIKSLNACFRSYLGLADIVDDLASRVDLGFKPRAPHTP